MCIDRGYAYTHVTSSCANASGQLGSAPSQLAMRHPYLGRANQVLITHTTLNEPFIVKRGRQLNIPLK